MGCNGARPIPEGSPTHRRRFVNNNGPNPFYKKQKKVVAKQMISHGSQMPISSPSELRYIKDESSSGKDDDEVTTQEKEYNSKLSFLLGKYGIDGNAHISEEYILFLNLNDNKTGVLNFLREVESLSFRKLRKISITGMQELSKSEIKELEKALDKASIDEIGVLYLHSNDQIPLRKFDSMLYHLLPCVRLQVFLDSFSIEESMLKTILYNTSYTKELDLINCKIGSLSENFRLEPKAAYQLKTLDLYWTAIEDDSSFLDHRSLGILLRAIKNSNTGESLEFLHLCKEDYDKSSLKELLAEIGMHLSLDLDTKMPKPIY